MEVEIGSLMESSVCGLGASVERNGRPFQGNRVILIEAFVARIRNYFQPRPVEIEFFDDCRGINYIKVDHGDGTFELYSEYTQPTQIDLINAIFEKQWGGEITDIAMIEAFVVTQEERRKKLREICMTYGFPKDTWPALWVDIAKGRDRDRERVCRALEEWQHWLLGKCPIALIE